MKTAGAETKTGEGAANTEPTATAESRAAACATVEDPVPAGDRKAEIDGLRGAAPCVRLASSRLMKMMTTRGTATRMQNKAALPLPPSLCRT